MAHNIMVLGRYTHIQYWARTVPIHLLTHNQYRFGVSVQQGGRKTFNKSKSVPFRYCPNNVSYRASTGPVMAHYIRVLVPITVNYGAIPH